MRREVCPPRLDWQKRVEHYGFDFHTPEGRPYWDESAYYVFSRTQIDNLERATYELNDLCLKLVQWVIDERKFGLFFIPPAFEDLVVRSWDEDEPTIYGRFDLAYNGVDPPKLLEYNADTPTALLEAAVVQWEWLKAIDEHGDQFNSIHERLIEAWSGLHDRDSGLLHFTALADELEDQITVAYLRDTAIQAGFDTVQLDIEDIASDGHRFTDADGRPIHRIFKLYPWEWLIRDEFGPHIRNAPTIWMEPAWKMILSCKALLPMLAEMFPESPYLLPASFDPLPGDQVRKPILGREGANVQLIRNGQVEMETDGRYGDGPWVYQQLAPLPTFDGNTPIVGSWMVNGWACGIGLREDRSPITQNTSRFVPHCIRD